MMSTLGNPPGGSAPRVLMPTLRRINPHVAWCGLYEFEDVIRSVDDVHMLELERGPLFELRHHAARSLAWRGRNRVFNGLNPGLSPVVVDRDYDLFVYVCMNVWDLLYLNAIRDWRSKCAVKICYMAEFYANQVDQYAHLLRNLQGFDYVMQSFASSVPAIRKAVGVNCHHVPFAVDTVRFTPFTRGHRRVVDILSIGGRSAALHEKLLKLSNSRDMFYVYDTLPSSAMKPTNPNRHRDMLASYAKRAQLFVVNEAKIGSVERGAQSEVGARYFEGTAAGAVLIGRAPQVDSFARDFPWPDPVVEVRDDGSDVEAVLERLAKCPNEVEAMSIRNASHALRHHDWGHRWATILRAAGAEPRPALGDRLHALRLLASGQGIRSAPLPSASGAPA